MTGRTLSRLFLILPFLILGGCATSHHNPQDPFESFNRGMYGFNDVVDKAVAKPLAKGYRAVVPATGRTMVSNFFSNLNDVIVTINDLLQFKIGQAFSDGGRVLINTTAGGLGLVDVASHAGFEKHNEDFGQTLGRWGVGSGPYLVLPLLGPSSIRDGVGLYADTRASVTQQLYYVETRNQATAVNMLSKRAALLDQEGMLDEAAVDRYSFIRDAYLQHRQSLVYDGNPPRKKYYDEEYDDEPGDGSSSINEDDAIPAAPKELSKAPAEPVSEAAPQSAQEQAVNHIWVSRNNTRH